MYYFKIEFGISAETDQSALLQAIRQAGGDAIQTSNGLFARSESADLTSILPSSDGVRVEEISSSDAVKISKDVTVFVSAS